MRYFAKLDKNNIVTEIITATNDEINAGKVNDCIETDYYTRGNVHVGSDHRPDEGIPLRGNFAGVGFTYDKTHDVFYAPQRFPGWTLSQTTWEWEAPTPYPTDSKQYVWDEKSNSWKLPGAK
jgi:hypothetical protein